MSNIIQEVLWPGSGLNTDDANVYQGLGDSPYRLNILVGEDGSNGVITNSKGNRLATYKLENSNAYQVLGSYYNSLTRKCYYWVFSQPHDYTSSGDYIYDNNLLVFDEDTKVIQLVFHDTKNWFGLALEYPIRDADMLGNYLYFNPRISEPKMIDVVRAWNYTYNEAWEPSPKTYLYGDKVRFFGGVFVANRAIGVDESPATHTAYWDRTGDCYQSETDINFDSEFRYAFNVIRHIPVYRPTCNYGSDLNKHSNDVRGKLFRFTHRYKFFDDTYSLYGAYSDWTLPINDEYYNGEVPNELDLYNYINVNIKLHSAALVKEIDIIFQEIGGDWKRAKIINRWDQTMLDDLFYTYKFYNNDSAYEVIDVGDDSNFYEIYDSVPRRANTQELINKNILAYGRPTEGFDNIDKNDIDVSLTPELIALTVPDSIAVGGRIRDNVASGDIEVVPIYWGYILYIHFESWYPTFGMSANDMYTIKINDKSVSYIIQAADVASIGAFTLAIEAFLKASFPTLVITSSLLGNIQFSITTEAFSIGISTFYQPSGTAEVALSKFRGFKTGAWHPFCIFYYDAAMRRSDAQTSKENIDAIGYQIDGTTVYVPMFNEISPTPATTANKWNINWEINHSPISGSKWWRFGYAGNTLASSFRQYTIELIEDSPPLTRMDIAPLQTLKDTAPADATWNEFPQSIISPYVWQKGDRVRIITEASAANDMGQIAEGIYDYEIVKYEESTDTPIKYFIYVQDFAFAAAGIGVDSLIEIYTPLRTNTAPLFYEFGELMPIIEEANGTLVHGAGALGTQDQDTALALPATGTFEAGDVYHILRTPSKPINGIVSYFHESQWYSDFYDSDTFDGGRTGIETSLGEKTLNIIRYSNQYLQDTRINGLSTFEGDHYKELTDIYGNIMSMVEVGTTLKVYMEKKSASILIGRQEYLDTQGQSTIATSNVVLGSIRYPENSFGTQWLESVIKNNRYVYGFDIYNAVMWRDSANGLFPISGRYESVEGGTGDYKMASWFKAKSDALMLSGIENIKVITVWDERYKNLFVTFKDKAVSSNNETIVYHEPSNRWITFTNFSQTPAEGWNEMLELTYWILKGFENGIGYFFDEDTRFAVFDIPHTTTNVFDYAGLAELTFEALAPTVTATANLAMDKIDFTIQALTPIIVITYVHLSVNTMLFLWTDSDETSKQSSVITCVPLRAYITDISDPSWIIVTNQLGDILSEGLVGESQNMVSTIDTLWVYPAVNNSGPARQTIITITNTYGDTDTITVTQEAAVWPPIVNVSKVDGDAMTLTAASGTLVLGSRDIDLTFTPSGTTGIVRWRAEFNSVLVGFGTFVVTNGVVNYKTVSILADVLSNETVYVYLSSDVLNDITAYQTSMELTLQALEPTVIITYVTSSVSDMTWNPDESGLTDMKATVIHTPYTNALIQSMPSWISIESLLGLPLYVGMGSHITDGDIIHIFPTVDNLGYELTGEIVLANSYGDTATITVTHLIALIPPGESLVPCTVSVATKDKTGMTIMPASVDTFGVSGNNLIYLTFIPFHPWYGNSEAFTMYWKVYVNGVLYGSSTFVAYNEIENSLTLTLSSNLLAADVVVINLSSMIF